MTDGRASVRAYLHGDEAVGFHPSVRSSLDVSLQAAAEVLEHRRPSRENDVLKRQGKAREGKERKR